MTNGDRRSSAKTEVSNTANGNSTFAKPYDNIGTKTFNPATQNYADYAKTFIYDVHLSACPEGAQDGRVFVQEKRT